jgi:peptide/nickel transport system substrate-binding protein
MLMVVGLFLVACAGSPTVAKPSTEQASATPQPSLVRIGWKGGPDTLNPGTSFLSYSYTIFNLVYDTMYELGLDNTFRLSLAESVQTSADGKVWTYKIRSGVQWHDGLALTAHDIAFTYNFYHTHTDFPYLPNYTAHFTKVEAPDDTTVVITLDEAIPNMEAQLVFLYVLPEHIWSKYAEGKAANEYPNNEMIGSGPFKMVEYKQNEFVHLAANPNYFGTKPKVDGMIFQTFGNEDALVQALKTDQADMITEIPKTAVPSLRNAPNIKLITGPPLAADVADIYFNLIDPAQCPTDAGGKCTGHPALRDRTVREALAHATDKQNIIDIILLGLGTPGLTLIPNNLPLWYNASLQDYKFDLAEANRLLDDAGYKDTDGDGVREMPGGGKPLAFRLQWPNDSLYAPRMAELLGQSWQQIGVKVDPQTVTPDALLALCCPAYDFDIVIWGWATDPDPNLQLAAMISDAIPTGSNETGYSNPQFDELYRQQSTTLDLKKRQALVWQMQKIVFHDLLYIVPFYAQTAQAYRSDRFTGWLTEPSITLEDQASLVNIEPVK